MKCGVSLEDDDEVMLYTYEKNGIELAKVIILESESTTAMDDDSALLVGSNCLKGEGLLVTLSPTICGS